MQSSSAMAFTCLCLLLALTCARVSLVETSKDGHNPAAAEDELKTLEYKHGISEVHKRAKRSHQPTELLRIMTFNVRSFSAAAEIGTRERIISHILNGADLIATQEVRNMSSAQLLLTLLNEIAGPGAFDMIVSASLPEAIVSVDFSDPEQRDLSAELYVIYFRTSKLNCNRQFQTSPVQLRDGESSIYQLRPPLVAEFTYGRNTQNGEESSGFAFTVITMRIEQSLYMQTEINTLHALSNTIITPPHCYSGNIIVLGDFGESISAHALDQDLQFQQLEYDGDSVDAMNQQKPDRIYVRGRFTQIQMEHEMPVPVVPLSSKSGHKAVVQRFWYNDFGVANPIQLGTSETTISDHHPVQFHVNTNEMPEGTLLQPVCTVFSSLETSGNSCEDCLDMSLTGGVFPAGTTSSVDALNIAPTFIGRNNQQFLNFANLEGAPFIFANEERQASWCGTTESACTDCRGATGGVSIVDQCSDRIMCPNLAQKLFELLERLRNCTNDDRNLIVHDAWREPDSTSPEELNTNTLQGQGLEAIISISEPISLLPIIERRDYSSDSLLLPRLASLALCSEFDFIKMNSDNNTLSVAVAECFSSQNRVPLCTLPALENGEYIVPHEGPSYQHGEYISAVCAPGHQLQGQVIRRQCQGIAGMDDWSGENPKCIRACDDYDQPTDPCVSTFIDIENNLVELRCLDSCDSSCQTTYLQCNHTSGQFEVTEYTPCETDNNSCDRVLPPYNGIHDVIRGTRDGTCSAVEFSCFNGSSLVGNPILTCQPHGQYNLPVPSCSGEILRTEFTILGFIYLRASSEVDIRRPSSLSSTRYSGEMEGPFPPLNSGGYYDEQLNRAIFGEEIPLPFAGLSLSFTTEVKLDIISYITSLVFYGRVENPIAMDVSGTFVGTNCDVLLTRSVDLPEQGLTIQASLTLESCDNCSSFCSSQAVSITAYLALPLNATLQGSYTLTDDQVIVTGNIELSGLYFSVSARFGTDTELLSPQMTNYTVLKEVTVSGLIQDPFNLMLYGTYSDEEALLLSGTLDLPGIFLTVVAPVNLSSVPREISSFQLDGVLRDPFNASVSGRYTLDEDVALSGILYIAPLQFTVSVVLDRGNASSIQEISLNTTLDSPFNLNMRGSYSQSTGEAVLFCMLNLPEITLRAQLSVDVESQVPLDLQFFGNVISPFEMSVSGSYFLEELNSNFIVLEGSLDVPGLASLVGTVQVDVETSRLSTISFEGMLAEPLGVIVSGNYSDDELVLRGNTVFQDNITIINVDVRLDISEALTVRVINFYGNFPPPLDFISYHGVYDEQCSCALLTGVIDMTSVTVEASGTVSFTDLPYINELQIQAMLDSLNLTLTGMYAYSSGKADVQDNSISTDEVLLSGSLLYDFAELNASLIISLGDNFDNMSSRLSDIALSGRLTDPFQLDVQGMYALATDSFTLRGYLSISQILTLQVGLSLDTALSPPSVDEIDFSGALSTPISFEGDFVGNYNVQTREASLRSQLFIMGARFLNATASLVVDDSNTLLLQSVKIEGTLDSLLAVTVTAVYDTASTEFDLTGQLSVGSNSLMVIAHAEREEMTNNTVIREVTVSGLIQDPFYLMLYGIYSNGETLLLSGTLDLPEIFLNVVAPVNLSSVPREISSFQLDGVLREFFNASVSGRYTLDEDVTLSGILYIAPLQFNVSVVLDRANVSSIQEISLNTTLDSPFNLDMRGSYSQRTGEAVLSGMLNLPEITLRAQLSVDVESQVPLDLQFFGNVISPFEMSVSGSYFLEELNSNFIVLEGSLDVPGLASLVGTVQVDVETSRLSTISFEGMLAEPLGVIVSGNYSDDELVLRGNTVFQDNITIINVDVRLDISEALTVRVINFYGNFPPPLDFISYHGVYDEQCSCALLTGVIDMTSDTVEASGTVSFTDLPYINELQIQAMFDALNLTLTGMYAYSSGKADVQDNSTSADEVLLSGSLLYDFAELNASLIISLGDNFDNMSSRLSDIALSGRLTDPFQLDVQGMYALATDSFTLRGYLSVSQILTLQVGLSLDTALSPPSVNEIDFSGALSTPISFEGDFVGNYNVQTREASLRSQLFIMGARFLNATASLVVDDSNTLLLQSVEIEGTLDSLLAIAVTAVYDTASTEFDLTGQLSVGSNSLMVTAHAEREEMTNNTVIREVTVSGLIQDPFSLMLYGTYSDGETLLLSGTLDLPEIFLNVVAPVNLSSVPREVSSFQLDGVLREFFNASVSGRYTLDEDVALSGILYIAPLQFNVSVVLDRANVSSIQEISLNTTLDSPFNLDMRGSYSQRTGEAVLSGMLNLPEITLRAQLSVDVESQVPLDLQFFGNIISPFEMSVSGSYFLEELNSNFIVLEGSLDVPGLASLVGTVQVDVETSRLSTISFEGMLAEPLGVIVSGNYSDDELVLRGNTVFQDNITIINVDVRLDISEALTVRVINFYGNFPPPLDFISYHGVYDDQCSCALLTGVIDMTSATVEASGTVSFTDLPYINELQIQAMFDALNLTLTGVYAYSSGKVDVQDNSISTDEVLLSGSLLYDFAELNASLIISLGDNFDNMSSRLGDIALSGRLTDPFQLDVQGMYALATDSFTLRGYLSVSQILTLQVGLSLDTALSPPSVDEIDFSGALSTPISFEGNFVGNYNVQTREASLRSQLFIMGARFLNATASLVVDDSNTLLLQSVKIEGTLDSLLAIAVTAVYDTASTEFDLTGQLSVGSNSLMVNAHAEREEMTNNTVIREVTVSGLIQDPFYLMLYGTYSNGETLLLSGTLDLPEIFLNVVAPVNLSSVPREISSFQLDGVLREFFNASVSGRYTLDEDVTLSGILYIAPLQFNVSVVLDRANVSSIQEISLNTTLDSPFNLNMRGSYSQSTGEAVLSGMLNLPEITLRAQLSVDVESQVPLDLQFFGNVISPFEMSVSGSYFLEELNSNLIVLEGSLDVPGLASLMGTIEVDIQTNMLVSLSFASMLSEPFPVMISGSYNTEAEGELLLRGSAALQDNITMVNFEVELNTAEPVSVREISLDGNFPSPLDFISYEGVYNHQCSCAVLTGRVVQDLITVVASTNLTFINQTSPAITELQIQVTFNTLNVTLVGEYIFSDENSSEVNVAGLLEMPPLTLESELQLIVDGTFSFDLGQFRLSGTLPPPLSVDVQGNYDFRELHLLLSGFLVYDFGQLNASVLYDFRNGQPSTPSEIFFKGRFIDPFQIDVQGQYVLATRNFMLQGNLSIIQNLTLRVNISLDVSTSPPSIEFIDIAGTFVTPIPFEGDFGGRYDVQAREALLHSHLDIVGAALLNATARLLLEGTDELSLQSVTIEGVLDSPLSVEVEGTYVIDTSELDLTGQLSVGSNSLMVTAHAERDEMTNETVIRQVTVAGLIYDPFNLMLSGEYFDEDTLLLLNGTLDLPEILLNVVAPIDLSRVPREISSFQFDGILRDPFNTSVAGRYIAGNDLVLSGVLDIPPLHLTVNVTFDGTNVSAIEEISVSTRLQDPFNLDMHGSYDILGEVNLLGMLETPILTLMLELSVDIQLETLSSLLFSGNISSPFMMNVSGSEMVNQSNYSQIMLSGHREVPGLEDFVGTFEIDLETDTFLSSSFEGMLTQPLPIMVSGSYNSEIADELILRGSSMLQDDTLVYFNVRLDTFEPVSVREISLDGNFPPPLDFIAYSGVYSEQCSCAVLRGRLEQSLITTVLSTNLTFLVPPGTPPSITEVKVEVTFRNPINMLLTGIFRLTDDNSTTIDLADIIPLGILSRQLRILLEGLSSFTVTRLSVIATFPPPLPQVPDGNFPPPLDFISYSGQYRRDCSCAMLTGEHVQSLITVVASTNLTYAVDQTPPPITELQIEVTFHGPVDFALTGAYRYNDIDVSRVNVMGQFIIPEITLTTQLQLLLEGMPYFTVMQLSFSGRFPPPLALDVQGNYNASSNNLLLSGSLVYDFAELDASVIYSFEDVISNRSSMLGDLALVGSLISPFQLDLQGQFVFATNSFVLTGKINASQYLMLAVDVSVNTSTFPPSTGAIVFSGALTTPISFQRDFEGLYNTETSEAILNSQLFIVGASYLNASARIIELNNAFSLQMVSIEGILDGPLSVEVSAIYIPSDATELDLVGQMLLGPSSFMVTAHAELNEQLVIREVTVTGMIMRPFNLMLSSTYLTGNTLLLRSSVDLPEIRLAVTAPVNLTISPREISSFNFDGELTEPFNASVTGTYSSGEDLVLSGMLELASLEFSVDVIFNTSAPSLTVNRLLFTTTYNPLSLNLIGSYNQENQELELLGIIPVQSVNISATASINVSQKMQTLSAFTMSVQYKEPLVLLSGIYDPSTMSAQLLGTLVLESLQFRASASLSLGLNRQLEETIFRLNYSIPFGPNRQFMLSGRFDDSRGWIILENNSPESPEGIQARLIVSTRELPSQRLTSLSIPQIDIDSLVNDYLGFTWLANAFPLAFSGLIVYDAQADLMYDSTNYIAGFHARGEVKIFVFPRVVIEATLVREPAEFRVSSRLERPVDWSAIAICGMSDSFCNTTGPELTIIAESGMNRFEFNGRIRLFEVEIDTTTITVTRNYLLVSLNPTQEQFAGLGSTTTATTIYWNNQGFYTNLRLSNVVISDFMLQDVITRSTCQNLGGYISELAIDAPFSLDTFILVREIDNDTIFVGAIFKGYATLSVQDQEMRLNASIQPIAVDTIISRDQPFSWNQFLDLLAQGLRSAAEQIVNDLLQNSDAVSLIVSGRLGQLVTDQTAQEMCQQVLQSPPPPPPPPQEVLSDIACPLLKVFGGCNAGNGGPDRDSENIESVRNSLGLNCNSSICQHNCQESGDLVTCSCNDGYYLDTDHYSCIRYDRCFSDINPCSTNAQCEDLFNTTEVTCTCLMGYTGNGITCTDIDECAEGSVQCSEHSTCNNTVGSFSCDCDVGYVKVPDDILTCTRVTCPPLSPRPNTEIAMNGGNMFNQTVVFRCSDRFVPRSSDTQFELTCTASGEWSSELPYCVQPDVFCLELLDPINGRVLYEESSSALRHGGRVQFICNTGYTLEGANMAECQSDGTWSAPVPTCLLGLSVNFLFPYGDAFGDQLLPSGNDVAASLKLSAFFPYYDSAESDIFVSDNGILSFRQAASSSSRATPFPTNDILIAPFWADVDTRNSSETPPDTVAREDIGQVWFREAFDADLLNKAGQEIREAFVGVATFNPKSLFIATWSNVGYFSLHTDKLNTFQCILATDGILSFVIYLYPRNGIQWTTGDANGGTNGLGGMPAQVGFNAGDGVRYSVIRSSGTADVVSIDESSNVMKPGIFIYQVDGTVIAGGCSENADLVSVFPLAGSALGGSLLSISGPCFDEFSSLECDFEGATSDAVFLNSLRAYCPIPMLNKFGTLQLTVSGRKKDGESISFPPHSFTSISLDYISGVQFDMPGVLLHSNGDEVSLLWMPNDVMPTEIADPGDYQVAVEVYTYVSNAWILFEEFSSIVNSGSTVIPTLKPGPDGVDPIIPIAFRIKAVNSSSLEDYIRPLVQAGNVGIWSPVAYKIARSDYRGAEMCTDFFQNSVYELDTKNVISCPCRVNQARAANSAFQEQLSSTAIKMRKFFYPKAATCFLSTVIKPDGEGQECCYDSSGLLLTGPPNGGTADRFASRLLHNPWDHRTQDLIPQIHCCKVSSSSASSCQLYYSMRPSDNCETFNPAAPAVLFGDPHMITLDGLQYTYNGAGEYVILDGLDGDFILQARTEPVERLDGGTPVGTAFTALAARLRNSDTIEIRRSTFRGLTILVNGERISLPEQSEMGFNNLTVSVGENNTARVLFEGGITVQAENRNNFILMQIASLPLSYLNNTQGLLGVWNGDPNDDLQRPDGTVISSNSSLREIHELFGEFWRINSNDSLFTYPPGQSPATFDSSSFTPVFELSDLPFANMSGVAEICGDSLECLFDVGATGDIAVGLADVEVQVTYNETVEISQPTVCEPECQHGAACVLADVCNCPPTYTGSRCEIDLDECVERTHNCEQNCTNTDGGFSCSCLEGYALLINEASCGDINECALGINECQCDQAFDRDHSCVASCVNTVGSYLCVCNEGHMLASDDRTCIDVDECAVNNGGCRCQVGLEDCSVSCNNLNGSHICECSEGYYPDTVTNLMCIDIDECETDNGGCLCDSTLENSNCISSCLNSNGSHSCSCSNGFELTDNRVCIDTNECAVSNGGCVCDQGLDDTDCVAGCTNAVGSYSCICNDGFALHSDERTCLQEIEPEQGGLSAGAVAGVVVAVLVVIALLTVLGAVGSCLWWRRTKKKKYFIPPQHESVGVIDFKNECYEDDNATAGSTKKENPYTIS